MTMILTDLGHTILEKMIISKILYSLSLSYKSIITAWSNVSDNEQIVDHLEERILRHES